MRSAPHPHNTGRFPEWRTTAEYQELEGWRKRYEERERERKRNEVVQSALFDAHKLQQLHRDKMAPPQRRKRRASLPPAPARPHRPLLEARAAAPQG